MATYDLEINSIEQDVTVVHDDGHAIITFGELQEIINNIEENTNGNPRP